MWTTEIDLDINTDPMTRKFMQKLENLNNLIEKGVYIQDENPAYTFTGNQKR